MPCSTRVEHGIFCALRLTTKHTNYTKTKFWLSCVLYISWFKIVQITREAAVLLESLHHARH